MQFISALLEPQATFIRSSPSGWGLSGVGTTCASSATHCSGTRSAIRTGFDDLNDLADYRKRTTTPTSGTR